jgi:hypothetical protein
MALPGAMRQAVYIVLKVKRKTITLVLYKPEERGQEGLISSLLPKKYTLFFNARLQAIALL